MSDDAQSIVDNIAGDILTAFHRYVGEHGFGRIPASSEADALARVILGRVADIADAIDLKEGYAADVAEFLRKLASHRSE